MFTIACTDTKYAYARPGRIQFFHASAFAMPDVEVHNIPWPTAEQPRATGRLTVRACQSCASLLRLAAQRSPLESSRGHGSLESDDGKAQSLPAELLRSSCSALAFEQDAQALRLQTFYNTHGLPGADMTGLHRLVVIHGE